VQSCAEERERTLKEEAEREKKGRGEEKSLYAKNKKSIQSLGGGKNAANLHDGFRMGKLWGGWV